MSRLHFAVLALLVAACEGPKYAQFAPLTPDVAAERAVREHFSMPVPTGWRAAEDVEVLSARETPPANGRIRAYRTLVVQRIAAVLGDDEAARRAAAVNLLRQRYAEEGLAEVATGQGPLAGRESVWLFGSVFRGSVDVRFDVLAYVIPCRDEALLVEFATPEGQFENARAGFAALAGGLETDLAPPRGSGSFAWFADGRLGVRVDDDWTVQKDVDGCAAVLTAAGTSLRGEVQVVEGREPFDLDRLVDDYGEDAAAPLPGLRIVSIERGRRDGRAFARIRCAYQDGARVLIVDELMAPTGRRLDRVRFVVPVPEWGRVRDGVERAAAGARWKG